MPTQSWWLAFCRSSRVCGCSTCPVARGGSRAGSRGWVARWSGWTTRVTYDPQTRVSRTERFIVRSGKLRRLEFSLEQVPGPELANRLRRAGFASVELFGEGGSAFGPDSRRLIAVAHKGDGSPRAGRLRVSLREIDEGNVRAVCELKVAPGHEKYVARAPSRSRKERMSQMRGFARFTPTTSLPACSG